MRLFSLLLIAPTYASPSANGIILGRDSVQPFPLQLPPSSKSTRYYLSLRTLVGTRGNHETSVCACYR